MATKVKGDAIKEGSIPLSALSSEVKDKIENVGGGADWNAKEGESGYIKNKPFGEGYEKLEWQYSDEYGCLIAQLQTNKIFINGVEYTLDYQDVTSIYVNGTEYGFLAYDTFIVAFGSDDSVIDTLTNNVFALGKSVIDEKYLPDTVLKTTPQTLSDDDKNQALVNLGIDPVVWKYMCNPFVIKIETECYVPEELVDLDSLFNSMDYGKVYTFKYLIPAMYVGYDDMTMRYYPVTQGEEPIEGVPTLSFDENIIFIDEEFKIVW